MHMNSPAPFKPSLSYGLIAVNVFVFLCAAAAGHSLLSIPVHVLQDMGGNLAMLSLTGDAWRLFTSLFLHGGLVHILSNMYLLVLVGPLAERVYGRTGMLMVYLIGGLWASLASACWNGLRTFQPTSSLAGAFLGGQPSLNLIVSVGASGALMALCGAMLVASLWQSDGPQDAAEGSPAKTGHSSVLLQVIGINLVMGFVTRGVDQAAHFGGLLAGLLLGAAIGIMWRQPDVHPRLRRLALVGLASVGLLAAALYAGAWPQLRELRAEWDEGVSADARRDKAEAAARTKAAADVDEQNKASKAREEAAAVQRKQKPPPVPDKEATGRVWEFAGKGSNSSSLRVSADGRKVQALDLFNDIVDTLNLDTGAVTTTREKLNPTDHAETFPQQRTDGLSLRRGYEGSVVLVGTADQVVKRQWLRCPVQYMGDDFSVAAAFLDKGGHNIVAALGQQPVVRVTDLDTGLDVGFYPTVGYPIAAQFSADGKHLYILSNHTETERLGRTLSMVDLSRRMADAGKSFSEKPLICEWRVGGER